MFSLKILMTHSLYLCIRYSTLDFADFATLSDCEKHPNS